MANDLGLPAVPRGLDRELRFFLQNLVSVVGRLAGLSPGSKTARAVRVSESSSLSSGPSLTMGSVTTTHLADLSVTTKKLADKCVTAEKLAPSAVDGKALKAGEVGNDALAPFCVTSEKIADGAVTKDKLAQGVLPVIVSGAAVHGDTVSIPGLWKSMPVVAVASITAPEDVEPGMTLGATDLGEVQDDQGAPMGRWQFVAVGSFTWAAIGYAATTEGE